MVGIAANSVVAFVTDVHLFWKPFLEVMEHMERNPVCVAIFTCPHKLTITRRCKYRRFPGPAFIVSANINMRPESGLNDWIKYVLHSDMQDDNAYSVKLNFA